MNIKCLSDNDNVGLINNNKNFPYNVNDNKEC